MNSLVWAGILSFTASLIHIGVIFGGPNWYRFFGAGERMAQLAEAKSIKPILVTIGIALMLLFCAVYAWSGAGIIAKVPFLKYILMLITAVYMIRGLVGIIAPYISTHPAISANSKSFWFWSSLVCLVVGVVHFYGVAVHWSTL